MNNIITTEKIFSSEFEPRRWIINKILPTGLSLLTGKEKIGKSMFALYLSVRKSVGFDFLELNTVYGEVLYVNFNDSIGLVQKRLKKMFDIKIGIIHFLTDPNLIYENFITTISKILLENRNINFIVIDSFDKVIKCNKSKYEILHNLKILSDVKNIGIFVISNDNSISCFMDTIFYLSKNTVDLYSLKVIGKDIQTTTINLKLDENLRFIKNENIRYFDKNEDETILALSQFINNENKSFKGTSTDLLNELLKINNNLKTKVNTLTRKLNSYKSILQDKYNILYENRRIDLNKIIILNYIEKGDINERRNSSNNS